MTLMTDLEPCRYFPVECEALIAVGWLAKDAEFATGPVDAAFFLKLTELCTRPWEPVASAGFHICDLCQFDGARFSANVFVPYRDKIYVAPVGIVHYVAAHWYRPPHVFTDAVLACPPMNSMGYKKALLANGGRALVRAGR